LTTKGKDAEACKNTQRVRRHGPRKTRGNALLVRRYSEKSRRWEYEKGKQSVRRRRLQTKALKGAYDDGRKGVCEGALMMNGHRCVDRTVLEHRIWSPWRSATALLEQCRQGKSTKRSRTFGTNGGSTRAWGSPHTKKRVHRERKGDSSRTHPWSRY